MRIPNTVVVLSICSVVGCGSDLLPSEDGPDDSFTSGGKADNGVEEGSPEARAVLVVVDTATVGGLAHDVGLSDKAAASIPRYRAGADGQAGTADDRTIDTLAELDSVKFIGPNAFAALLGYTAPMAMRLDTVSLMDPHAFVLCNDATSWLNGQLKDALVTDANPSDGFLDFSLTTVFRPLDPRAVAAALDVGPANCTAPAETTECSPTQPTVATVSTNQVTGSCLDVLPGTSGQYDPAIVTSSAPCFSTDSNVFTLVVAGVELKLADTRYAARFENKTLVDGLIRGFLDEAEANATILPDSLPVVGGKPLSSLFRGGPNGCGGDDRDDGPGGVKGWYFYLNFTATPVRLSATP